MDKSNDDAWEFTSYEIPECPVHPGVYHLYETQCRAMTEGAKSERARIVQEIRRQGQVWFDAGVTDLKTRYDRLADNLEAKA